MEPCPHCRCKQLKPAFAIRQDGPTVALACMRCEYIGPEAPMDFPPGSVSYHKAADLWDTAVRQKKRA